MPNLVFPAVVEIDRRAYCQLKIGPPVIQAKRGYPPGALEN
jgi:hypothetical protein